MEFILLSQSFQDGYPFQFEITAHHYTVPSFTNCWLHMKPNMDHPTPPSERANQILHCTNYKLSVEPLWKFLEYLQRKQDHLGFLSLKWSWLEEGLFKQALGSQQQKLLCSLYLGCSFLKVSIKCSNQTCCCDDTLGCHQKGELSSRKQK